MRTDRLIAERLRPKHFDELRRMHRDPRVMGSLAPAGAPNGGVLSDEKTRRFLHTHLDHWDRYGYGLWAFRDRANSRFVGRAGLVNIHVGGDEVELAYALVAEYWGRGLATEIAKEILTGAFERLGMEKVVCFTLTTNRPSQRVMEKAGFEYERNVSPRGTSARVVPHQRFRVGREPQSAFSAAENHMISQWLNATMQVQIARMIRILITVGRVSL